MSPPGRARNNESRTRQRRSLEPDVPRHRPRDRRDEPQRHGSCSHPALEVGRDARHEPGDEGPDDEDQRGPREDDGAQDEEPASQARLGVGVTSPPNTLSLRGEGEPDMEPRNAGETSPPNPLSDFGEGGPDRLHSAKSWNRRR